MENFLSCGVGKQFFGLRLVSVSMEVSKFDGDILYTATSVPAIVSKESILPLLPNWKLADQVAKKDPLIYKCMKNYLVM